MGKPYFVTLGSESDEDDAPVTLLVRLPGDRDFFSWGVITEEQRQSLDMCGVFDLDDAEEAGVARDD